MPVEFSPQIYRKYNLDLRHFSDEEAESHFLLAQGEKRVYAETSNTTEFLSMRWLRGNGIEIGAGKHPTRLFGKSSLITADCDEDLVFGGRSIDFLKSLDAKDFAVGGRVFDFAIASHVLEHVDSFIRALENLTAVTKAGGIVYIVLPDIGFLFDATWMPEHNFSHHAVEYETPNAHSDQHDRDYLGSIGDLNDGNEHADITEEYKSAIRSRRIPEQFRFMHHKHNYDFGGWLHVIESSRSFLNNSFKIVEARYGYERMDCHFVLEVLA